MSASVGRTAAAASEVLRNPSAAPERITVALIPAASQKLQKIQDRTGLSKTDVVNRAITLYEFTEAQTRNGRDLLLRDNVTGEIQNIIIL
jgi:hypothetical protein